LGRCADLFDIDKGGRKIVGEGEITIHAAEFDSLALTGSLVVKGSYSQQGVKEAVENFIADCLAHGNFPMGEAFIYSDLAAGVMNPDNVEGVKSFVLDAPGGDIAEQQAGRIFDLGGLALAVTGGAE
jgi:hypothetical protein